VGVEAAGGEPGQLFGAAAGAVDREVAHRGALRIDMPCAAGSASSQKLPSKNTMSAASTAARSSGDQDATAGA